MYYLVRVTGEDHYGWYKAESESEAEETAKTTFYLSCVVASTKVLAKQKERPDDEYSKYLLT